MVKSIEELLGRLPSRVVHVGQSRPVACPECGTPNAATMAYDPGTSDGTSHIACGCGWQQRLGLRGGEVVSYRAGNNGVDGIGCLKCGSEIDDYGAECGECKRRLIDETLAEAFA